MLGPRHGAVGDQPILVQGDRAVRLRRQDVQVVVAVEVGGYDPFRFVGCVVVDRDADAPVRRRRGQVTRHVKPEDAVRLVGVQHVQVIIVVEVGHVYGHSLDFSARSRTAATVAVAATTTTVAVAAPVVFRNGDRRTIPRLSDRRSGREGAGTVRVLVPDDLLVVLRSGDNVEVLVAVDVGGVDGLRCC